MEEPVMPTPATADTVSDAQANGFVANYFGVVALGHQSRNRCFARVARQLSRHPGGTLPDKLSNPADYAAMDRLMNRDELTHAAVLASHRQRTLEKMRACAGPVLLLHDTTVLDYSGQKSLGLAPVGNGHGSGYLCHNSLAVDPQQRAVFGLVSQLLHQRARVPRGEGVKEKRERHNRESRLWSQAVAELPAAPAGQQWVDVADRGGDLFEFLATERQLGRRCVVRSAHNRRVQLGHDGQGEMVLLHTHLRTLPAEGPARSKTIYDRQLECARVATLRVSFASVTIAPPHVRRGDYEPEPIQAWAVRVWEEKPPAQASKLEWLLVCLDPVADAAAAWQKSDWYGCRWMVEEYHKAQKTGCQIENLQFRTVDALQPMIALLSVVAILLLNLRQAARRPDAHERPATTVIEPIYEEVLRGWRHKTARAPLTVYEFYLALARLGGHMNRKRDGFPGWLTLWRGWQKLQSMVAGVEIERRQRQKIV
jgi:hypothetical protein